MHHSDTGPSLRGEYPHHGITLVQKMRPRRSLHSFLKPFALHSKTPEVNSIIHIQQLKASVAAAPALAVMRSGSCKTRYVSFLWLQVEVSPSCWNSDAYMLAASAGSLHITNDVPATAASGVSLWMLARDYTACPTQGTPFKAHHILGEARIRAEMTRGIADTAHHMNHIATGKAQRFRPIYSDLKLNPRGNPHNNPILDHL